MKAITSLEQSEKRGTENGLKELASLHGKYGMKYNDSLANDYLYAAAQYYFYENNYDESKSMLFEYISRDDSTERFRNAALNLAQIQAKEGKYKQADELVSETLDKMLPTSAQWQDIIGLYADKISNSESTPTDYERIALAYTATAQYNKALMNLDSAIAKFPEYEKRGDLMYRAGFIGWDFLNNKTIATNYYNQFLAAYPEDPKAAEVKKILSSGMLDMNDEQILEMLKGNANN
ncbi:MAG: hypothetical protein KJP21_05400 [Bacteroidia bacterium]|nr:hypothetical protein [Bacteroidia bacterium]